MEWNEYKCTSACREELRDKQRCDKRCVWNPSNCNCKCDKSCSIGEYLDYKNYKCRQKIAGSLVKKCSKNIDENEIIYNETVNVSLSVYKCGSCILYIVLFVVYLVASVIISAVFVYLASVIISAVFYFHWYLKESNDQLCLKEDNVHIKFNPSIQTTVY